MLLSQRAVEHNDRLPFKSLVDRTPFWKYRKAIEIELVFLLTYWVARVFIISASAFFCRSVFGGFLDACSLSVFEGYNRQTNILLCAMSIQLTISIYQTNEEIVSIGCYVNLMIVWKWNCCFNNARINFYYRWNHRRHTSDYSWCLKPIFFSRLCWPTDSRTKKKWTEKLCPLGVSVPRASVLIKRVFFSRKNYVLCS